MTPTRRAPAPVQLDDRLELDIAALGRGGDGIARLGRYIVLVPGTLPGERVLVEITSAAKKFGRGELIRVLRPVPTRTEPRCRHYLACGGCDLQHLDYQEQLRLKQQLLTQELQHHLGEAAPPVAAMMAPPEPYGARHKVAVHLRMHTGELQAAFHRARSLELVPITECPASAPAAVKLALATVRALAPLRLPIWDAEYPGGLLRSVLVRTAAGTDEAHVIVVAASQVVPGLREIVGTLHRAGATTVSLNVNDGPAARLLGSSTTVLSGPPRIQEHLSGIDYLISPEAFFQTSPAGAMAALGCVKDALQLQRHEVLADLFCGGGLFALPLSRTCREVIGIELSRAAIFDADASMKQNHITNVRFVHGDVLARLGEFGHALPRPHKLVLDPPRDGCGQELVAAIAELRPARIAYVSCNQQALAADLVAFAARGFRATLVTPIDMFPHTGHVEAVAALAPTR